MTEESTKTVTAVLSKDEQAFSFSRLVEKIEDMYDWQVVGIFFIWVFLLFTLIPLL